MIERCTQSCVGFIDQVVILNGVVIKRGITLGIQLLEAILMGE